MADRYLTIEMSNGAVFRINSKKIAEMRARRIATRNGIMNEDDYQAYLCDPDFSDLNAWIKEMRWAEIYPHVQLVTPPRTPDYQELWHNAQVSF